MKRGIRAIVGTCDRSMPISVTGCRCSSRAFDTPFQYHQRKKYSRVSRRAGTWCCTDASGTAAVKLAKGRYELVVWKSGYDAPVTPIAIETDAFAAVWPHVEGDFADKFNTMPKYVVSSTLESPEWNNTTVLRGDVVEEVAKLKERHERDIVVHGSPQLAQTLIEHDLVDELRLMVYPVIEGAGKRLFAGTTRKQNLHLVKTKTFNDGIHVLVYRPPNR